MYAIQGVKCAFEVVIHRPEPLGAPVAIDLGWFDVDVVESVGYKIQLIDNWCCSECEVIAIADICDGASEHFTSCSTTDQVASFDQQS